MKNLARLSIKKKQEDIYLYHTSISSVHLKLEDESS